MKTKLLQPEDAQRLITVSARETLTDLMRFPSDFDNYLGELRGIRTAVHYIYGKESVVYVAVSQMLADAHEHRASYVRSVRSEMHA